MDIETRLRTKRGHFLSLDAVKESPEKLGYKGKFEGAILVSVNGRFLTTEAEWDCVDLLWGRIVQALEAVSDKGSWVGSFVDMPLKLEFRRTGTDLTAIVGTSPPRSVTFDYGAFVYALLLEAKRAFTVFISLSAQNKHSWYERYLHQVNRLLAKEEDKADTSLLPKSDS